MFGKILNMLLNWVPKLKMFHFKISLNIKGRSQRLIGFIFVNTIQNPFILNSNIYHSYKREPSPFFIQIPVLGHVLIHSIHKTHDLLLTKILLTRTNSKIFEPNIAWSNVKLISQKYFKSIHVNLHFTQRLREFFLYTLLLPSADPYSEPLQISKAECFCLSS